MSIPSWQSSLQARLAKHPHPKVTILGIGHELRGDDAVGVIVARELQTMTGATSASPLQIIAAGTAPEAFTGQLRRFDPDLVLMIDAAQLDQPPGAICVIEWQAAIGLSASTHTLPLSVIAHYLVNELGCEVVILGIQSAANEFDRPLSPQVQQAADEVTRTLTSLFASLSA